MGMDLNVLMWGYLLHMLPTSIKVVYLFSATKLFKGTIHVIAGIYSRYSDEYNDVHSAEFSQIAIMFTKTVSILKLLIFGFHCLVVIYTNQMNKLFLVGDTVKPHYLYDN